MILKVDDSLGKEIIEGLNAKDYKIYGNSFDVFVDTEIEFCEDVYGKGLGEYTLNQIRGDVETILDNEEMDFVTSCYFDRVQIYSKIFKSNAIGYFVLESKEEPTKVFAIKEILKDEVVCTCNNDVYQLEIIKNKDEKEYVVVDNAMIPIGTFTIFNK